MSDTKDNSSTRPPPRELTWYPAEGGEQEASSAIIFPASTSAHWRLQPTTDGHFVVDLIVIDTGGPEAVRPGFRLGAFPDEASAKDAALRHERSDANT